MLRLFQRRSLDDSDRISRRAMEIAERLHWLTQNGNAMEALRQLLYNHRLERRHHQIPVAIERRAHQ